MRNFTETDRSDHAWLQMTIAIGYRHLDRKDPVSRVGGRRDALHLTLDRRGIIPRLNQQLLPYTNAIENIVGRTKGHLYAIDISDRKSRRGRRHEASLINVPAENVAGERSLQVGVTKKQLSLAERCLCVERRSVSCIENCLRLFVVRLGETLRRIQRFRSLEVVIGLGVLRHSLIDLGLRLRDLVLQIFPAN